ncbi:hypothetical protein [Methanosarcina horonobensis]|uniref:hypothetical protein n=1 Tax=Methanosarcina horonobensis TaxID=418008 RepID=UPI000AEE1F78|nr:hypothetical protein [Methanosarcina horonobensis]
MRNHNTAVYPFTAIVGQERMKKSPGLKSHQPETGGVLIRGEKGTAKSTAVRLLPISCLKSKWLKAANSGAILITEMNCARNALII